MNASAPAEKNFVAPFEGRLPYKWLAMITAASATLVATVTISIVNISLPSIAQGFGASIATVQWVLVIYPLITVSMMLAVGYLGDVWGRKRIFTAGSVIFAVGSFLCGVAQDPWQLIAFRVVQAAGGAMVVANSAAIVTAAVPAAERGKSLGIVSTVAGIGLSVGPALGGILVDTAGWRWVFFVAVPLSVLTAALAALYLRDRPRSISQAQPFDVAGAVLLFISLTSFLMALGEAQENGWSSARLAGLAAVFLISAVAFVLIEQRAALPTVDLALLGDRFFAATATTGLLAYMAMFTAMFLMPFYLTGTAGYSSAQAGTLLTAIPLAMALTATISGWLSDRFGPRWLCAAGMGLCTTSFLLLAQLGHTAAYGDIAVRLLVLGLGVGIFMSPNNSAMMGCVPAARLGMASALVATVRHLGVALGVAVGGGVFTARLATYATPGASAGTGIFDPAASVGAFRDAYLVLALLCAIGILTSLVRGPKG